MLTKTVIIPYYRANAGLLTVVAVIAGSFMRAQEHIALATYAVHSGGLLLWYFGLWALYMAFATRYGCGVFRTYDLLQHLRLFPAPKRWWALMQMQAALLLPVIAYALFVVKTAVDEKQSWAIYATGMAIVLLIISPLPAYEYVLRHPNPVGWLAGVGSALRRKFTTPYGLFFVRYLLKSQPFLLATTKIGTCLAWVALFRLYATDHAHINFLRTPDYDIRLLGLAALIVGLSHASIVYAHYQFEHQYLTLYRNMPVSTRQRWFRYVGQFALLLLPEFLLMLREWPVSQPVGAVLAVWIFAMSLLSLQHGLLLRLHRQIRETMTYLYIMLIAYFLLIMFRVPLWFIGGATLAAAGWLFSRYYWRSAWEE